MDLLLQHHLYFYPRPPRGGRLNDACRMGMEALISIHALREEGDINRSGYSLIGALFLSTPSARRATKKLHYSVLLVHYFYPRPPRGGRRCSHSASGCIISIFLSTPSARRATVKLARRSPSMLHFYPRPPRGGRHILHGCYRGGLSISIHALREEGDLSIPGRCSPGRYFYPRPPRGGRPCDGGGCDPGKSFLSTPSARRATFIFPRTCNGLQHFYPRPPRGGRPRNRRFVSNPLRDFYPRPPRGGRPSILLYEDRAEVISIHALREEGDHLVVCLDLVDALISIHALREEGDSPTPRALPGKVEFLSTPSARRATRFRA